MFLSDLIHAFRPFRHEPALTGIAILSLAIGLGATSGAASLLDAFGFRPPAVTEPDTLVQVLTSQRDERFGQVSYPDYEDMRDRTPVLSGLSAYGVKGGGLSGPGAPPAVVISDRLWQRRFSRADDITHRFVVLNGASCAVIGVLPPAFTGLTVHLSPDVWIPFATWSAVMSGGRPPAPRRDERTFTLVGRLKSRPSWRDRTLETFGVVPPGVRHAQNEFDVIVAALRTA